jgi:hypothetical protein
MRKSQLKNGFYMTLPELLGTESLEFNAGPETGNLGDRIVGFNAPFLFHETLSSRFSS